MMPVLLERVSCDFSDWGRFFLQNVPLGPVLLGAFSIGTVSFCEKNFFSLGPFLFAKKTKFWAEKFVEKNLKKVLTNLGIGFIIRNVLEKSIFGQVVEWLMAPDCKSGRESVRWFESISAHHNIYETGVLERVSLFFF